MRHDQNHRHRVLREQQRHLRRRRRSHPRRAGGQDRQDRTATAIASRSRSRIDNKYQVPADAKAVILSPSLVTARVHPADAGLHRWAAVAEQRGDPRRSAPPSRSNGTTCAHSSRDSPTCCSRPNRAASARWDRSSTPTADNLRGQGANIRDTIIELSQAFSALGDHSDDIFSTLKNLSILVSALQDSADLMRELNQNLASVTALLADDPNEVGNAVSDLNAVVGDAQSFIAENRESLGTTVGQAGVGQPGAAPTASTTSSRPCTSPRTSFRTSSTSISPRRARSAARIAFNNFANPITFLCGAIQAASRLGAEQSAKLCVQYLAPIVKNRQYNFPPLGENLVVGAMARPNEVTYSEDWLRPDYVLRRRPRIRTAPRQSAAVARRGPYRPTPADGLPGMMMPPGGGLMMRTHRRACTARSRRAAGIWPSPRCPAAVGAASTRCRCRAPRAAAPARTRSRRNCPTCARSRAELPRAGRAMSRSATSPRSSGRGGMRW